MRFKSVLIAALLCVAAPQISIAQTQISEAEIEESAKEIGRALRCVVCQNQSIEESDASLAEDMRRLVRARVREGDSKDDVIDFMQARYGDFVLLKPPVQRNTYALWALPFLAAFAGLFWVFLQGRKQRPAASSKVLSADEQDKLDQLLGK